MIKCAAPVQLPPLPHAGPARALARAFGCARVVFNDGLRARQEALAAGLPYLTDAELSARLTAAKATPERAWLGEVSAVVLQQALADLNAAYRNFFASVTGQRKGPKVAPPRFRSRKDRRQAIRFTPNARFSVLRQREAAAAQDRGRAGAVVTDAAVAPSSVTVIKDAARPVLRQLRRADRARYAARDRAGDRHRPRAHPFRGAVRRPQDRLPAVPAPRGEETQAGAAGLSRKQRAAGTGTRPGQARQGARPGGRCAARVLPPAVHGADPRKPSGRRGRPGRQRAARTRLAKSVTTPGGRRSCTCWSTRPGCTAGSSTGSAGSSPPPRCARPAGPRTAPSRCTSAPGGAGGAGRGWTGTSTRRSTSPRPPGWR